MEKEKSYEIVPSNINKGKDDFLMIDNFKIDKREEWDSYFMNISKYVAKRSTCDRANVGCLIVNGRNRVVAIGYNGSCGSNTSHCDEMGHVMRDNHCIATVHAEINALCDCAYEGKATKGCKVYVTHFPCLNCTKALIQAGISEIFYQNDYRVDDFALELLKINKIKTKKID